MQLSGDNGIITQAQNATYMQSIAALEEYLQTEYVKYYDEADDYTNKIEMLSSKMTNLCLKDGTKNYITYDGKMYYLVNKQSLPDDIKNQLKGGDTTEYIEYIRLIDVYGITEDLRVYYCADGLEGALGTVGDLEVDPSTPLVKVNNDGEMKSALTEALAEIGIEVGEEGITVGDIVSLKDFELDGTKYNITSLSAISELTSLQTLTLKNVNINNLDGIEGCSQLYYLYLKDCKIGDYSKLGTVLDLKYLYIYLSPSINETDANVQITNLGNGLASATSLNELEYFGISGVTDFYENIFTFSTNESGFGGKFVYLNNTRSNVTDISSLSSFALNIKNSIKYMYLNNNKITSIAALEGFNNIYELDLMCNSTLSNLKGLENHSSIVYLTVHACNLTDISGLQGTTDLKYFTIQHNFNLKNLNGLEQSTSLDTVLAYSCNITDITALADHTNLKYLSLYSNVNLENVITLGNLTGLKNLYLANNENMIGTEVRDALANPETHILQNCGENYSIPSKYNIYFATLTSYDYSNMNLTDDSDEINALKNRTNVESLDLSGNSQLSNEKLQEILSTMTGLKALSLKGCTNLTSIDFIGQEKVTKLMELDLRDTNPSLIDLTNLNNYATNLNILIINNKNMNITSIQDTISRCGSFAAKSYFISLEVGYGFLPFDDSLIDQLEQCTNITYLRMHTHNSSLNKEKSLLDLSNCIQLAKLDGCRAFKGVIKFPSSVKNIGYTECGYTDFDFSLCSSLKTLRIGYCTQTTEQLNTIMEQLVDISQISDINIDYNDGNVYCTSLDWINVLENKDTLNTLKITNQKSREGIVKDIEDVNIPTKLKNFTITYTNIVNMPKIKLDNELTSLDLNNNKISDISNLDNFINLTTLTLNNNKVSNISALSNLKKLTTLTLNDNNISDISQLENLIENGKIKFTNLNLSNNLLQTTTVGGHNNVDTLTKLFNAGLRSLNISGNNFTPGSTDSLKNLGWTSYIE